MNTLENVLYATHGNVPLCLNLQFPKASAAPVPVILWLPGGGWFSCDLDPIDPFLCEAGFAVASVRYRVSGEAIAPANIIDCLAAVRWLRANAAQHNLDPDRIGVFGSSAGGHLAALTGLCGRVREFVTPENADVSSVVQAACDFCGPSDLTSIAEPAYRAGFARLYEVTALYLGGPVEERLELARLVSPLHHVSADAPPLFIAHGACDQVVCVSESERLHAALCAAGADSTLHILPDANHGWDWNRTNDLVARFFRRTLQ